MPFGPIMLDLQGFYQSPLNKTLWRSFVQILRAMVGLTIVVSACVLSAPALRTVPLQVKDFRHWVRLDLDYIDRWSLGLDLKFLLRTIPAAISGLGAK